MRSADVFMEGFRPGAAARLGADYDTIKTIKPDIIYASLAGYGQTGPYSGYAGHDINYVGLCGLLDMTGPADGLPSIMGVTVADGVGGGMNAAISILSAVIAKLRYQKGNYIDMAIVDGVLTLAILNFNEYVSTGVPPGRSASFTRTSRPS